MIKFTDEMMEEYCLIKSEVLDNCLVCGYLTNYIEYITEARFCSVECMNEFYEEFLKGISKHMVHG